MNPNTLKALRDRHLQAPSPTPERAETLATTPTLTTEAKVEKRGRKRVEYPATIHPTTGDIRETAGFYEGEGTYGIFNNQEIVQIGQNDREKLDWMQLRFGGKVYGPYSGSVGNDIYHLRIVRNRALGFMFTIFTFLSKSRKSQFTLALKGECNQRVYQPTVSDKGMSEAFFNRKFNAHIEKTSKLIRGPLAIFGVKR